MVGWKKKLFLPGRGKPDMNYLLKKIQNFHYKQTGVSIIWKFNRRKEQELQPQSDECAMENSKQRKIFSTQLFNSIPAPASFLFLQYPFPFCWKTEKYICNIDIKLPNESAERMWLQLHIYVTLDLLYIELSLERQNSANFCECDMVSRWRLKFAG